MGRPTLTRYLLAATRAEGGLDHAPVLSAVAVAMQLTASLVSRGPLIVGRPTDASDAAGAQGAPGVGFPSSSEVNRALREQATAALIAHVSDVGELAGVSIAERPGIVPLTRGGRFLLLVDPIHGMSSLEDNLAVGTAFSVLEITPRDEDCTEADFLQPGSRQVCAGLALFGPRTLLILTNGRGVDGFTVDREVGNFVLTHPGLTIPPDAHVFAIDASDARCWPEPVRRYVDECTLGAEGPREHDFTMRWNASAVFGAFRTLHSGGVFLVPEVPLASAWLAPLLHTAAPLAFLAEQAGGRATTGRRRVLDLVPASLGERVPLFLGDAGEVTRLEGYFHEHDQGDDRLAFHPLFRNRSLFVD